MRIPVPWLHILAYLIGYVVQRINPIRWPGSLELDLALGLLLIALGTVLAFSAQAIFRKRGTTTVPFEKPSSLVTSGPYGFTRNPMYVGLALVYLGVAATRGEVWPVIVLPLLLAYVNFVVIPVEEGRLYDVFGEKYQRYTENVRRWL
jgi:protein-S-isoprenylcysteine O-methyltransferase Ste14